MPPTTPRPAGWCSPRTKSRPLITPFRVGRDHEACRCFDRRRRGAARVKSRISASCFPALSYRHICRLVTLIRFDYCRAPSPILTPPSAATARLDRVPLPLPEKKPAAPAVPARADRPFRGIALILASTIFLGISDVTAKYLSATLPSIEIAWIRFVVFAVIMTPAMIPGSPLFALQTNRLGLQMMRGVTVLASSLFFISGLKFLPIAEASATGFVAPLLVTALSIV